MEWIELRRGGKEALAAVFEKHRERLLKMAENRLDSRVAIRISPDDVLQESFVEASRRLADFLSDPRVPVFIWLRFLVGQQVQIAHRRHLRTNKRSVGLAVRGDALSGSSLLVGLTNLFLASDSTPSVFGSKEDLRQNIRRKVDSLEAIDREILTLRHYEELSNTEVAAELLISKDAASKRYRRALKKLRSAIDGDN